MAQRRIAHRITVLWMARPRCPDCLAREGGPRSIRECVECRRENTRQQQRERAEAVAAYKLARGCERCGFDHHPAALHLHHRDPSQKGMAVSVAVKYGWARLWAEVAKCDVICANCHAALHADGL